MDPPFRFALLASSLHDPINPIPLYRGSLPKPHNLPFLSSLSIQTIISLTPKTIAKYEADGLLPTRKRRKLNTPNLVLDEDEWEDEEGLGQWIERRGVKVLHFKTGKAKDGAIPFSPQVVKDVLETLLEKENYPIYIHDLDGSDCLAIMGAALRKLQGWPERSWVEEMSRFLRQPPPEPEHLTFLRRLFSPNTPSPEGTPPLHIVIPPPSRRVPWLWPQGLPVAPPASNSSSSNSNNNTTNSGNKKTSTNNGGTSKEHATMRVKVEEDEPTPLEREREREKERELAATKEAASRVPQPQSRTRSVTPNQRREVVSVPPSGRTSPVESEVELEKEGGAAATETESLEKGGETGQEEEEAGGKEEQVDEEEDDEEEEEEEGDSESDDEDEDDEEAVVQLSQTIDALDLF